MVDSIYRTRSLGVAAVGLPDQYADGKAAKVWEYYIGSKQERTKVYKDFICNLLNKFNCKKILDVACGTGVDSIMLIEEGFELTSTDASDKMLKYALKERWNRRKESNFEKWIIEEANWLTLYDDLTNIDSTYVNYDAVICLGNSFPHLPDFNGDLENQKLALNNFYSMIKPGGLLLIDHRNYDYILNYGQAPSGTNILYMGQSMMDIKCSNLYVNGRPTMVTLDYVMDLSDLLKDGGRKKYKWLSEDGKEHFRLSYYPHRLQEFNKLLQSVFQDGKHIVYDNFQDVKKIENPTYYLHLNQKT